MCIVNYSNIDCNGSIFFRIKGDVIILDYTTIIFPHLQSSFSYSVSTSFRCHGDQFRSSQLSPAFCGPVVTALSPSSARRGGLSRGTGPRFLPETARLRGVPNRGEGLPSRVSGQLPGGGGRTGRLLHPPPQQTQEIHLPVH